MNIKRRIKRVEEKKKYKSPEKEFPLTMDATYNAHVILQVKVPAMLSAIIKSECSFLGVSEEAFITNLIVRSIRDKENDREREYKKYLNERNKNATNRVELQHNYEQLGSKS
jgi:hypothetical protein